MIVGSSEERVRYGGGEIIKKAGHQSRRPIDHCNSSEKWEKTAGCSESRKKRRIEREGYGGLERCSVGIKANQPHHLSNPWVWVSGPDEASIGKCYGGSRICCLEPGFCELITHRAGIPERT
ncbi:unnamed protein product [Staurois parvus]|uniref:Uncharacterized protein n=1 Tax=Staurois parvus TaxID=386267 RepID=A0ABN9CI99_9NEOB|nr:unnamed protein product [Staurois parvus]